MFYKKYFWGYDFVKGKYKNFFNGTNIDDDQTMYYELKPRSFGQDEELNFFTL